MLSSTICPFIATMQVENRVVIPPPIIKILGIKKGDVVDLTITKAKA